MIIRYPYLLLAAAIAMASLPEWSAAETIFRNASAGKAQWMDDYYGWDNRCNSIVYDIDVVQAPAHGKVAPRPKQGRIPANAKIGSSGSCAGKPFKGWSIFYTARAGYHGNDAFRVRMRVGGTSKYFDYRVNVR